MLRSEAAVGFMVFKHIGDLLPKSFDTKIRCVHNATARACVRACVHVPVPACVLASLHPFLFNACLLLLTVTASTRSRS